MMPVSAVCQCVEKFVKKPVWASSSALGGGEEQPALRKKSL